MDTSNPDSAQTLSSIQAVKVKLENCAQILLKNLQPLILLTPFGRTRGYGLGNL